jgi:integrase/recombinase XerD
MEEWIDYLKKMGRKTQTVAMYKSHVQALQRWWEITGNQEPIWMIDSTDLETYKLYLERQSYSLSTLVQKFAAIKSFLNWAASVQLIDAIPKLPNFPPIQEQIHSSGWLTDDEVEAVLNDVELRGNLRDAAIIRLLLNIGLSADELCNLKWSDLNWNEQYITCSYRQVQQVPLSIAAISKKLLAN